MAAKDLHKIPDVFHLKPLNNFEPKVLNNGCHCNCHHQIVKSQAQPESLWTKLKDNMSKYRMKKTRTLVVVIGLICFVLGFAVPFLFLKKGSVYDDGHLATNFKKANIESFQRFHRPLLTLQHEIKNNTLQNVFISVKTTRKYHYPRVVILLETWAALVKSQVRFQLYFILL